MKKIIAISAIAAMATVSSADTDVQAQLEALKAQIQKLEKKLKKQEKSLKKVSKKVKKVNLKASQAKALAANDNLKFSVDFRTSIDSIEYTRKNMAKAKNSSFLTNRLWLKGAYAPSDNIAFYSTLSYNKAYGDSANHSQANTNPGYANFDWITNENATDNTLKVKEAYWLYKNDTFLDSDVSWTASVGRRPSTDGLGINLREDQPRKSALSHTVNVEFDGASARWNIDKITGVEGMWFKLCLGRGLTNAKPRFSNDGLDYSKDDTKHTNVDMAGLIFVPYDNGQYSVHTNYARAMNAIGFKDNVDAGTGTFSDMGDLDLMTAMFKAEGIGNEINDFLDNTVAFASFARSKSNPASGKAMLGSTNSQTGHSTWLGVQMPCPVSEDGRIGVEWNKGSKHWRSVTYGEDTMVGSKIAARGTAWEIYYNKPLTKALSAQLRYTDIDYDYTGSNGFFGVGSTSSDMASAANGTVTGAKDLRAYIRYRF